MSRSALTPHMGGIRVECRIFIISTESDILNALFAAASLDIETDAMPTVPSTQWQGFLGQVLRATGAISASLLLEHQGKNVSHWQIGDRIDWPLPELGQLRSNRVYSQADMPGVLPPSLGLRLLKCQEPPGPIALLILQRADKDFRAVDTIQLANLAPYLGHAVAIWQRRRQERTKAQREAAINDKLGAGWLSLSAAGSVIGTSAKAESILSNHPCLRLWPNGRLEFSDPASAKSFYRAVNDAQAQQMGMSVDIASEPPLQIAIAPNPHDPDTPLIGTLREARHARTLPMGSIARSFSLSLSESRLAALISDGFDLSVAATMLGWTVETTRSTSKQIYAKMGVKSQSNVAKRLQQSALWLE